MITLLLDQELKFKSMADLTPQEVELCKPLYDAFNDLGEKVVETIHWNYYPGRNDIQLTHSSTTKESELLGVQNHLEATAASTFKSIQRLLS